MSAVMCTENVAIDASIGCRQRYLVEGVELCHETHFD